MARDPDCIFCGIVAGDVDAEIVFEDEASVAFLDIRPLFHGHVLLVPREHHVTVEDLPEEQAEQFFLNARRLSKAVREGMGAQGTFMAMNNIVSQSVPHLHMHVVPRVKKDGLRGFFWPRTKYKDGEMKAAGEKVRKALG